jgi:hypothetical protein
MSMSPYLRIRSQGCPVKKQAPVNVAGIAGAIAAAMAGG